jgi:hypothetical protein
MEKLMFCSLVAVCSFEAFCLSLDCLMFLPKCPSRFNKSQELERLSAVIDDGFNCLGDTRQEFIPLTVLIASMVQDRILNLLKETYHFRETRILKTRK